MFFASHGECLLSCDMVVSAALGKGLGGVRERGWGGVGLSDSCFPSALSQAVTTLLRGSEGQRSEVSLRDMRGPKYFQLEGHPNLFSHIHGAYQASRAHSVLCTKYETRGERVVAAIWEWLCVFLIVSCLFTPALLSLAALLGLRWLGSLGLFQVLSPSCNLRPGMLNNSHSCTGVYISTCCSPHQWQKCAHRYGIKVVFYHKNFLFVSLLHILISLLFLL